jgi:hypothetical protein
LRDHGVVSLVIIRRMIGDWRSNRELGVGMDLEPILRKPECLCGVGVTLADGGKWWLPRTIGGAGVKMPDFGVNPVEVARGVVAELQDLLPAMGLGEEGPDTLRRIAHFRSVFAVASALLKVNYEIRDDVLAVLMPFNFRLAESLNPGSPYHNISPATLAIHDALTLQVGGNLRYEIASLTAGH